MSTRSGNVVSQFTCGDYKVHEADSTYDGEFTPGICVVVCTYKRPTAIARLLDSLHDQDVDIEQIIVVDSSPDGATERKLRQYAPLPHLAKTVQYFRVKGPLAGLTRQRNFALLHVRSDLVVFFDDDVVVLPGCMREMERLHRRSEDNVVGVGAFIVNQRSRPSALWGLRRALGMVSNLQAGTYQRSGISIPWGFLDPSQTIARGDWLHGGASMWLTESACRVRFRDSFKAYAQSEDLDFSLRMAREGRLLLSQRAQVLHLHDSGGRPDDVKLGFMAIYNRYVIHRDVLPSRTPFDTLWFCYAWLLDTLLLARHLRSRQGFRRAMRQIRGRARAVRCILREHCYEGRNGKRFDRLYKSL